VSSLRKCNHVLGEEWVCCLRNTVVFLEEFFSLGTNVLIVVLTKEIVVFHGEYGCVFLKEMQLYSWESVCVPQRTWFVFPQKMLFLEIIFCSTRVIFLWENGCVLWILCSLKKCNYVLKRILVFPKEMLVFPKEMLVSLANTTFCLVKEMVVFPKKMFDL
jgi:hypothetical protein